MSTKAKKGSKAWKAKLSKAQKAGWAKRRARAPKAAEELSVGSVEEVVDAVAYINASATPKERRERKQQVYGLLYGAGPKTFRAMAGTQQQSIPKDDPRFTADTKWYLHEAGVEEPKALYGSAESMGKPAQGPQPYPNTNPKTLTGNSKVPVLSVIPPASIIAQATAMRYGAFFAPRTDGTKGYGPYNWRDQPIEAHVYIDAAMRHLMQWFDGDESEIICDDEGRAIDEVSHLAFALATIGILLDAKANETLIDDRPKARRAAATTLLNSHKLPRYTK